MQRVTTAEYVEGLFKKIRDLEFEVQSLKDKYQRDVFGLNNEGDPIGGDPAGGYANDLARLKTENESLHADAGRLDFIERNNHMRLVFRKKHWSLQGFTNYEYSVFRTLREAIDAAATE